MFGLTIRTERISRTCNLSYPRCTAVYCRSVRSAAGILSDCVRTVSDKGCDFRSGGMFRGASGLQGIEDAYKVFLLI